MIPRYARPAMTALWEPEARFRIWFEIEAHALDAMAELGSVPREAADRVWAWWATEPRIDVAAIDAIEAVTKHDVIAFLTWVAEQVGPEARFLHQGMTSSDVLDTCLAVQLARASDILLADLDELLDVLKRRAHEHKLTPTIGRSHGIHAEPVTFGLKLAQAYAEFARNRARLVAARADIATCAISGAVGTFANIDPRVEAHVADKLGLTVEPVSTQVIPRDRHAMFFATLGVIASSIERLATEVRHLQRTEVLEAEEYFSPGQKGSSAMPHKRNPVLTENLTGLARMVRSAVHAGAGECGALARARHLPLLGRALYRPGRDDHARFRARPADRGDRQIARLSRADAAQSRPDGRPRPFAARAARPHPGRRQPRGCLSPRPAQRDEGLGIGRRSFSLLDLLKADPEVTALLSPAQIEAEFDLDYHFKHVDTIFARVFGEELSQLSDAWPAAASGCDRLSPRRLRAR